MPLVSTFTGWGGSAIETLERVDQKTCIQCDGIVDVTMTITHAHNTLISVIYDQVTCQKGCLDIVWRHPRDLTLWTESCSPHSLRREPHRS